MKRKCKRTVGIKSLVDKAGRGKKRVWLNPSIAIEDDRVEIIGKRRVRVLTLKLDADFIFKYPS